MTLQDLNKMTAREFNQLSLEEIKEAFANYRNSDEAKAKEEYAASLPSIKVTSIRTARDLNKYIWWNSKAGQFKHQVWIKADLVQAFTDRGLEVEPFNNEHHAFDREQSRPYIGGGIMKDIDVDNFNAIKVLFEDKSTLVETGTHEVVKY